MVKWGGRGAPGGRGGGWEKWFLTSYSFREVTFACFSPNDLTMYQKKLLEV
jgi:hypothetical protein